MDWTPKCPPYETQYSATTHTDVQDCVSESLVHIIYMLTGVRYSARALALMSRTTVEGNTTQNVLNTANTQGLIRYELWPDPDSFDWNTYYTPIPPDVLAKGERLNITLTPANLDKSPLWTELLFNPTLPVPGPRHMAARINETQYFDSEIGAPIKPLNYEGAVVAYSTSIIINNPPTTMNQNIKLFEYNGTTYVAAPLSTEDPDEINAFNRIFGINITVNADKTINGLTPVKDA